MVKYNFKIAILILLLTFLSCEVFFSQVPTVQQSKVIPEAEITNGILTAHFYLPDVNTGYYRATRFDWSGIITNLEYKGHTYYGKWFNKYEPTIHDVVMGPVEEFGPVGYNEAKEGGKFLKIGVGILLKPDNSSYNNFKLYEILDHGEWKIKKKSDQIQFIHKLKDNEYSYEYTKKVRLIKGKSQMVLEHTITNTGNRIIETTVYDHNFLMIDKEPTGPNYVITFPFELSGRGMGIGEIATFDGKQIRFLKQMARSDRLFCGSVTGFSDKVSDYDFTVDNLKTGAGVRVTCDRPISKMVFWCSPVTVCPEPYIDMRIDPGKSFTWTITFEYYTKDGDQEENNEQ